jgi:2-aminoethylphosphonate-pyruvate transaminase
VKYGVTYIVDSMSAFGAVPVDMAACSIDFLVSSSNKCIEGVPGFSFTLAKRDSLIKCKDQADTLVLDLFAQWVGLERMTGGSDSHRRLMHYWRLGKRSKS